MISKKSKFKILIILFAVNYSVCFAKGIFLNTAIDSILKYILGDNWKREYTTIVSIAISIVILLLINKNNINKRRKNKKELTKYCNDFVAKFTALQNIPYKHDIEDAYNNVGRKALVNNILVPLIINKLKIIDKLNLCEKYELFYTQNIDKINLFQLASYTVSTKKMDQVIQHESNINDLLIKNKYITINFDSPTRGLNKNQSKYLLYKQSITKNHKNILQMNFNRVLLFKEILLQIFLEDIKSNENIKYDIIKQINNYINLSQIETSDKKQLLITAIIENINKNELFKDKFLIETKNNKIKQIINNRL